MKNKRNLYLKKCVCETYRNSISPQCKNEGEVIPNFTTGRKACFYTPLNLEIFAYRKDMAEGFHFPSVFHFSKNQGGFYYG